MYAVANRISLKSKLSKRLNPKRHEVRATRDINEAFKKGRRYIVYIQRSSFGFAVFNTDDKLLSGYRVYPTLDALFSDFECRDQRSIEALSEYASRVLGTINETECHV